MNEKDFDFTALKDEYVRHLLSYISSYRSRSKAKSTAGFAAIAKTTQVKVYYRLHGSKWAEYEFSMISEQDDGLSYTAHSIKNPAMVVYLAEEIGRSGRSFLDNGRTEEHILVNAFDFYSLLADKENKEEE